jgi:hypothetical protein
VASILLFLGIKSVFQRHFEMHKKSHHDERIIVGKGELLGFSCTDEVFQMTTVRYGAILPLATLLVLGVDSYNSRTMQQILLSLKQI